MAISDSTENPSLRRRFGSGTVQPTKQSLTAATAAAPAGGTGDAAGAYDTAGNRDTAIALINNNATRIAEIENLLKQLGWLG